MKLEKRKHKRIDYPINIYEENGKLLGKTIDISLEGFFIETQPDRFKLYEHINILFEIPAHDEGSSAYIKILTKCNIVRNTRNGIGTKFLMNERDNRSYLKFLKGVFQTISH